MPMTTAVYLRELEAAIAHAVQRALWDLRVRYAQLRTQRTGKAGPSHAAPRVEYAGVPEELAVTPCPKCGATDPARHLFHTEDPAVCPPGCTTFGGHEPGCRNT